MPTTDAFQALTEDLFDGPLTVEATYAPMSSASFALTIIPDMQDTESPFRSASIVSGTLTFRASVEDLPAPAAGDSLTIGAQSFTVQGTPQKGPRNLWWQIEARPNADD